MSLNAQAILDALKNMGGLITAMGIELSVDGQEVTCRMPIQPMHTGAPKIAHGGAVSTLLDTTLGAQAMVHAVSKGRATSTVELKVNFLQPAREGHTLVARSTIQSAGRSLLVLSGAAYDEATDEQIAFAVGTFNLYETDNLFQRLKDIGA